MRLMVAGLGSWALYGKIEVLVLRSRRMLRRFFDHVGRLASPLAQGEENGVRVRI